MASKCDVSIIPWLTDILAYWVGNMTISAGRQFRKNMVLVDGVLSMIIAHGIQVVARQR